MPGMPRCSADLGQRHLELLQDGQQPLHRPICPPSPSTADGDLAGVERVVDPPVPGQPRLELRREAIRGLGGDQGEPGVRQAGRRLDEPRRGIEQIGRDKPGDDHGKNVLLLSANLVLVCPGRQARVGAVVWVEDPSREL